MKYFIKTTSEPRPDSRVQSKINGAGSWLARLGFLFGMLGLICVVAPARAAQPVKTTFAWGFNSPDGIGFDAAGNLYVANSGNGTVSKVTSDGTVSTFATGLAGPNSVAFDGAGNLYVANGYNNSVSKVTPGGAVSTFASGFHGPMGLAFDGAGNLYVANWQNDSVNKVTPGGAVSTFASGFARPFGLTCDSAGNLYVANLFGGSVSKVTSGGSVSTFAVGLAGPVGLAFDPAGNLYVANLFGDWVSKVTPSGAVSVFTAGFGNPRGLAFDSATNLYVSEPYWNQVRKVAPPIIGPSDIFLSSSAIKPSTGINVALGTLVADNYDTAASHTFALVSGDGDTDNAAFNISEAILQINDLSVMAEGSYSVRILTEDGEGHPFTKVFIITVDGTNPTVISVAVPADATYLGGQTLDFTVNLTETVIVTGTPALELTLDAGVRNAAYLSGSGSSNLVFRYTVQAGDNDTNGIVCASSVSLDSGTIQDAAGNDALLTFDTPSPTGVLVDTMAPAITSIIRLTPSDQVISGNAVVFQVTFSKAVMELGMNTFVVTPINNSTVAGIVTAVSGGPIVYEVEVTITAGWGDFRLDGVGPSIAFLYASGFNSPNALAFQRWGDLYVANGGDNTVSQVRYDGEVSTFAINLNQPTALATDRYGDLYVANGGDDTVGQVRYDGEVSPFASGFNQPRALAFDDDRNLYVANYGDGSVSKVNDSGDTSTFTTGLDGADSLAFDSSWNLYVGSSTNNLVTRVTSDGITNTFAIGFNQPRALAFDDVGNLFVANYGNGTVSRVTTNGVVTVFAEGFTAPIGLAFDRNSGLYVADQTNGTITRLTPVWINDLAGNAFPGPSFTSGENYTLATTNPTDITLSSSFVNQSSGTNATVGMLTTTDSDSGDIHTYTLVHGTGDTDNGFFSIATNALLVDSSALLAGAYSVRIQTDDGNGGFYEEAFVITVVDDVAPTVVSIVRYSPSGSNIVSGFATWRVTFSEPVTGVELGDFTLTQLGGNGVVFGTSVSGGPSVYDVTVEYIAGVSPMRLDLNALETGIADGATNAISGGYTNSEIYNFDNDGPAVDWVDVPADGNYRAGKSLDVTIHYFENTTVTGTPSIGLAIGSTARSAGYASGSGTRDIVFRYTVQDGDSDTDGIDLESIVALNGGTLQDAAGNNAALEFEHSPTIGVLVDGVAPQIASIIRKTPLEQVVATNSTVFEVTFTKDMIGIGVGSFKVTPTNDSTAIGVVASVSGGPKVFDVTVNVISGAGEFQLVAVDFSVTAFATGLTNPAGLAFDSTGNLYVSSFESDTQTGTVSRVTSDGSISLFATDVHSPFALAFDHAGNLFVSSLNAGIVSQVTSDGTVSVFSTNFLQPAGLAFDSAGDLYVADLESGTVSKVTTNGTVSVFATNLFYPTSLAFDRAGDLYVSQLFGGGIIKMTTNGTASVFATNIPFALALAFDPAGDLYVSQFATGGILKVTTNGMVSVVAVEVAQYFGLAFDSVGQLYLANPATGFITKVTGQPSTDLAGNSTIGLPYASDETYIYKPNGVPTDLALSSSSVNESSSTNATVGTLTTTDADSGDGHTYALVSGAGDANNALFVIEGDVLKVGTNTLVAGDYSVRIQTDDRNGGTYAEAFNIRVADDVSPAITGVAVPANAIYRAGQNLDFTVSFSELVSVTSTPMLSLTIGSTPVSAEYIFGNGSSNLLFRYTVQNGDNDTDGIVLISPLALNGGTIKDAAENNAMLNFTAPTTTGVLVDALAPQIISITRKTPGQQTVLTNTMIFTVTFSENVAGVSPARFAVTPVNGSTVAGTISSVSGGPTIYDVTVTITAGTGEFRLDVPNIQIPN